MKNIVRQIIKHKRSTLLLPVWMLLLCGCPSPETAATAYYTCPMHRQIREEKPGSCPVCGMTLIPVRLSGKKDSLPLDSALAYLSQPVTRTVTGTFNTISPVHRVAADTLTVEGTLKFDQRDVRMISPRVAGRIDLLYIRYSGQPVRKGQPLMKIYSPVVVTAQRELLQAVAAGDRSVVRQLSERLAYLGMDPVEIRQITESGKPLTDFTVFSPYEGIALQPGDSSSASAPLELRQGMYIAAGQPLLGIQGLSRRWALLYVFDNDLAVIKAGHKVRLFSHANPELAVSGRVDFIPPFRADDAPATVVRVYLDKVPESWKTGSLLSAEIIVPGDTNGLYIPLSSVNRLGTTDVVWVKDPVHGHVFHTRHVTTGRAAGDSIEILAGLTPRDRIVENAAYMVDSDSFIE